MTRHGTRFASWVAWIGAAALAAGCAADEPAAELPRLEAARAEERLAAYAAMTEQRASVARETMRSFAAGRDRSFGSASHLATQVLGQWRVEEAIPALAESIDYRLDPASMPAGKKSSPWALHPAADALRQIGGPTVRAAMLNGIQADADENRVRLYAWVLRAIEGPEAARIHLEVAGTAATAPEVQRRLRRAVELVEAGAEPAPAPGQDGAGG
jgi:hypothetical protein